jgi:NAD(P)-binding Rossmann-like domain
MQQTETDYLIIGSGASGMAFADTLLQETQGTDTHITLVDRHAKPGGHWNDAYPFVTLHQPSAFYGVNSLDLGINRKDTIGANQGMYELASGPEISGYYNKVMNQTLLPSGRVSYYPMSNFLGYDDSTGLATFEAILSGAQTQVKVRKKLVDANFFGPRVPATHKPKFTVAEGVKLVTPNALTQLWQQADDKPADIKRASKFCVLGAGKTAMDACIWLLNSGAAPDSISWVMPRDSWLVNRQTTQPGEEFFTHSIGGVAAQMACIANATSIDDLFLRMEASDQMLRIYPDHLPTMFHYATVSKGEIAILQRIKNVIRMGRVQALEPANIVFAKGNLAMEAGTLYIDCTASAVEPRAMPPIFNGKTIVLQLVRAPLPTFSAALIAYVEAHYPDDAEDVTKNKLCGNVPFPHTLAEYPRTVMVNMMNQMQWNQDKTLHVWMRESRLDGFAKLMSSVDPSDVEKLAILGDLKTQAKAAMGNLPRLMAFEN